MIHLMGPHGGPMRSRKNRPCRGGCSHPNPARLKTICPGSGLVRIASPGEPIFFGKWAVGGSWRVVGLRRFRPQEDVLEELLENHKTLDEDVRADLRLKSIWAMATQDDVEQIVVVVIGATMSNWPDWWSWEIRLSDHVLLRMGQRDFSEADLRAMLDDASGVLPDADPGRWLVLTQFRGVAWNVVLEPDRAEAIIVVITAFEVF